MIIPFHKEYYYLVASLNEYTLDSDTHRLKPKELRQSIEDSLSGYDKKSLELIYLFFDIENLLGYVKKSSTPFNDLGNLTVEQIRAEVDTPAPWVNDLSVSENTIDQEPFVSMLPDRLALLVDRFANRIPLDDENEPTMQALSIIELERELWSAYYEMCGKSYNKFVRNWSGIDKTIRNIVAASKARVMNIDPEIVVIGDSEIDKALKTSLAEDFGIKDEFEWTEKVMEIIVNPDFVEREHLMDALKWNIIDELCEQEYFSIDVVLGYLIKINIIHRWAALDKEVGHNRFEEMVKTLTRKPE